MSLATEIGPGKLAKKAYADLLRLARSHLSLVVFLTLVPLLEMAANEVTALVIKTAIGSLAAGFVISAASNFLVAPLYIALFEFFKTGNAPTNPWTNYGRSRILQLWGWLTLLTLIFTCLSFPYALMLFGMNIATVTIITILGIFTLWVVLRLFLVVPMVVFDREQMTLRLAFSAMRGHVVRVVLAIVLVLLPYVVFIILAATTLFAAGNPSPMSGLAVISALLDGITIVLISSIAATLYFNVTEQS